MHQTSKRGLFRGVLFGALALPLAAKAEALPVCDTSVGGGRFLRPDDPASIPAPPAPLAAREGFVEVPGGRLWYWDTGGDGQPLVLLHAHTGTAQAWIYQQAAFAAAGFRVLAYSRRGAGLSETTPDAAATPPVDDLRAFLDGLGLERAHLLGTAAGAFTAARFAVLHGERVLSLTISCSLIGLREPSYAEMIRRVLPASFQSMPAEFKELSPSYRAANPEGVARWLAIEAQAASRATTSSPGGSSSMRRSIEGTEGPTFADLEALRFPVHLIYGDADLYSPPVFARVLAAHIPGAEMTLIGETGHSAFWEQPRLFNLSVLEFLSRHRT